MDNFKTFGKANFFQIFTNPTSVAELGLAKNTPGAGAAKQALAEAKQQMMLTTGVLDGLREKAGQMLMGDTTAPSSIGAPQREEIKRLLGEIAQCQNAVM